MAITTIYQTSDGEIFQELADAQAHEKEKENLTDFYKNLVVYDEVGERTYIENIEAFDSKVWTIEFHNVEELNTLRDILNVEMGMNVAPYDEHKGLVYLWDDERCSFISLYDWFKNQASERLPNDKLNKMFPY